MHERTTFSTRDTNTCNPKSGVPSLFLHENLMMIPFLSCFHCWACPALCRVLVSLILVQFVILFECSLFRATASVRAENRCWSNAQHVVSRCCISEFSDFHPQTWRQQRVRHFCFPKPRSFLFSSTGISLVAREFCCEHLCFSLVSAQDIVLRPSDPCRHTLKCGVCP